MVSQRGTKNSCSPQDPKKIAAVQLNNYIFVPHEDSDHVLFLFLAQFPVLIFPLLAPAQFQYNNGFLLLLFVAPLNQYTLYCSCTEDWPDMVGSRGNGREVLLSQDF